MTTLRREQTESLRASLIAQREQLVAHAREELARLGEHPISEISGEVPDVGDESIAASLVDFDNRMIQRDLAKVRDIDGALERIELRDYGRCVDCDEPILLARLRAFPTATRCVACQTRHERTFAHAATPTL